MLDQRGMRYRVILDGAEMGPVNASDDTEAVDKARAGVEPAESGEDRELVVMNEAGAVVSSFKFRPVAP